MTFKFEISNLRFEIRNQKAEGRKQKLPSLEPFSDFYFLISALTSVFGSLGLLASYFCFINLMIELRIVSAMPLFSITPFRSRSFKRGIR